MSWVDRELQRKVLQNLFEVYPNQFSAICLHQKLFPDEVRNMKSEHLNNMKSEHLKQSSASSNQGSLQYILGIASDSYVQRIKTIQLESYQLLFKNIHYLAESELVEIEATQADKMNKDFKCRINNHGIDFLQDDGGLSAAINHGIVTVKLHSDTIQQLLIAKIDQSDIPEVEKSKLKAVVSTIRDAALSTLTENAINAIPVATLMTYLKKLTGL